MIEIGINGDGGHTGVSVDGCVSYQQFLEGCSALLELCRNKSPFGDLAFQLLGKPGCQYLATSTRLTGETGLPTPTHNVEDEAKSADFDDDEPLDEAAIHHSCISEQFPTVEYHVLHAPSYQVPILYLRLLHLPPHSPKGLDALYECLVPPSMKQDVRTHGILGGISIGNHPVTDLPAYFVHPCNTAEALRQLSGGYVYSPLEYLQIWFGLVGPAVGLYLPRDLFMDS